MAKLGVGPMVVLGMVGLAFILTWPALFSPQWHYKRIQVLLRSIKIQSGLINFEIDCGNDVFEMVCHGISGSDKCMFISKLCTGAFGGSHGLKDTRDMVCNIGAIAGVVGNACDMFDKLYVGSTIMLVCGVISLLSMGGGAACTALIGKAEEDSPTRNALWLPGLAAFLMSWVVSITGCVIFAFVGGDIGEEIVQMIPGLSAISGAVNTPSYDWGFFMYAFVATLQVVIFITFLTAVKRTPASKMPPMDDNMQFSGQDYYGYGATEGYGANGAYEQTQPLTGYEQAYTGQPSQEQWQTPYMGAKRPTVTGPMDSQKPAS